MAAPAAGAQLGGISLQFVDGQAPLYSVTGGQASFQVPWELSGQTQAALSRP